MDGQLFTTSILLVLNNFIKKLLAVKSNEESSDFEIVVIHIYKKHNTPRLESTQLVVSSYWDELVEFGSV